MGNALLELGRAVDLAGDEDGTLEEERRLPVLDDLEAGAEQAGAAGRGYLEGVAAGNQDAASRPEFRMDDGGQVHPSERLHKAVESGCVVEVAVTEDDGLDVLRRELEAAHVLSQSAGSHAGIEENAVLAPALRDGDERGEAVLCQRRVSRLAGLEESGGDARCCTSGQPHPLGGAVVHEEGVDVVVDERGDGNGVYRLEVYSCGGRHCGVPYQGRKAVWWLTLPRDYTCSADRLNTFNRLPYWPAGSSAWATHP